MSLRDMAQELRELGPRGTLFRAGWELKTRARPTAYLPPVTTVPRSVMKQAARIILP